MGRANDHAGAGRWSTLCIALALLAACAGMLELVLPVPAPTLRVHLLDVSRSHGLPAELVEALRIRHAAEPAPAAREALIAFADDALLLVAPAPSAEFGESLLKPALLARLGSERECFFEETDLVPALALARGLAGEDEHIEVVLHGDGRHEAPSIPGGMAFEHEGPLPRMTSAPWRMYLSGAPPKLRTGVPAEFTVHVACERSGTATARLTGGTVDLPFTLVAGAIDLVVRVANPESAFALRLVDAAGHDLAPALQMTAASPGAAPRVAVLDEVGSLAPLFTERTALGDHPDVICVGRVDLTRAASDLAALRRAVEIEGAGLVLLGGPASFAAGGWEASVLENLSPLSSRPSGPREILVLLDASGSMDAEGRWARALEAVQALARELHAEDQVQVIPFAAAVEAAVPVRAGPGAELLRAMPALRSRAPSGGTCILPLMEWVAARPPTGEKPRHTIVLSDCVFADAAEFRSVGPLRQRWIAAAGALTTLVLDPVADALADAARLGGNVESCKEVVPEILLNTLRREHWRQEHVLVTGGGGGLEALRFTGTGINGTRAAEGAQVLGVSPEGEPLLAARKAGAGKVLACASTGTGREFEAALQKFVRAVARAPEPEAHFLQTARGLCVELQHLAEGDVLRLRDAAGGEHTLHPAADGTYFSRAAIKAGRASVLSAAGTFIASGEVPSRAHLEWAWPPRKLASERGFPAARASWPWALLSSAFLALALIFRASKDFRGGHLRAR